LYAAEQEIKRLRLDQAANSETEKDLRERLGLFVLSESQLGSREFVLEELAQEINEKHEDLNVREKNLIRREEILEQRMESGNPPEMTSFPVPLERSENPGDGQNWWSYVWHTKRESASQTGTEVTSRDDVLEAQGVEIVTLRQVAKAD
jgi:hypothetical protein